MRMHNASLEKFKRQFDSIVLVFTPNGYTEVPDHLVKFVYEGLKDKGVFIAPVGMSDEAFQAEKRKALLAYMGITLRERNVNYLAYQDDHRKRGATLLPDPRHERCIRWEKELREILNAEAPIEEELSFLESRRVKNTEMPKEEEASFEAPKRRGRTARAEVEAQV